ncbi:MAG: anti-sigma factor [Propionibacteriaceae bacterium]
MPYELRPPRPAVLNLIRAELAEDESPTAPPRFDGVAEHSAPVELSSRRATPRSRRRASAAIAAVALAAVSVGGVLWYQRAAQDDVIVVARATLQPLPDKSGEGTAELIRQDGADQLRVDAHAGGVRTGFEELWLINTDGQRMISLGVLPPDGQASYPVPVTADGGLDGYTIVDISLEPFDGNAAHSKNSLLRGSLG